VEDLIDYQPSRLPEHDGRLFIDESRIHQNLAAEFVEFS